ncbi:hypothetical protein AOQ84DRAFT_327380 [Glonium stellatum]|uniref:Methyltransferase domain-containing protein n=1 Tax=Glonium stellatum TaxID=574774 RepID=A0A8E2EPN2_9PEZI|nr:hypothetical protein AOQ84DRAFT_327380 [Glonium stellatum]
MASKTVIMEASSKDVWDPANTNSKQPPEWFIGELKELDGTARAVFEKYSGLSPDAVIPHIVEVRNRAFDIFPYPCIGLFRFLDLAIRKSPNYPEVLQRLKDGQSYLDIGCCFGQDIRKLVADGAPSENTYGSDLRMDFMELGYDLFLDRETLKTKFIAGDIFDPDSPIKQLDGKIDIINASSFLHLFSWDQQVKASKVLVSLLKPQAGGLIIGRQMGDVEAKECPVRSRPEITRFRHNGESFKRMWKLVGDETGTDWQVDVRLTDTDLTRLIGTPVDWLPAGARAMSFTIRRL